MRPSGRDPVLKFIHGHCTGHAIICVVRGRTKRCAPRAQRGAVEYAFRTMHNAHDCDAATALLDSTDNVQFPLPPAHPHFIEVGGQRPTVEGEHNFALAQAPNRRHQNSHPAAGWYPPYNCGLDREQSSTKEKESPPQVSFLMGSRNCSDDPRYLQDRRHRRISPGSVLNRNEILKIHSTPPHTCNAPSTLAHILAKSVHFFLPSFVSSTALLVEFVRAGLTCFC